MRETFCDDCGMTMAGPCSHPRCPKRPVEKKDNHVYTVVGYRPDHTDWCRGCAMGSSSSDFNIEIFSPDTHADHFEATANGVLYFLKEYNQKDDLSYAEYETYVLVDGNNTHKKVIEIRERADELFQEWLDEIERQKMIKKFQEEKAAAEKAAEADKKSEEEELKLFYKLREKYEGI